MKKLLTLLGVLVLAVTAAYFFTHRRASAPRVQPAFLLPASTLAYVELPDLRRTVERWEKTALHELWAEAEVQAFLAQPREKLPQMVTLAQWRQRLAQARPRQLFAAVTSLEADRPHFVAGLSFDGSRAALEALLAEPRQAWRDAHPAGQADLLTHGAAEIQTFTDGPAVLAETVRGPWYFVADSVPALKALLDRFENTGSHPQDGLASDEVFRETRKPLPDDAEVSAFVRLEALTERLTALLVASGQPGESEAMDAWKRLRGLGAATRIQGTDFQDTWFAWAPGTVPQPKLALSGLAITTPETMAFYTGKVPQGLEAQLQQLPAILAEGFGPMLKDSGLLAVLDHLGPELSLAMEWPSGPRPELTLAAGAADQGPALRAALEKIGAGLNWQRLDEGDTSVFQPIEPDSALGLSPTLAVTPKFLLGALSPEGARAAVQRTATAGPTLAKHPGLDLAAREVPAPTESFGFLNTAALLEKLYGTARPLLAMSLAFNPATAPYLDASKLPSSSALSRHLGTSIFSRVSLPEGELLVARGPLSLPQLAALVAGAGLVGYSQSTALRESAGASAVWPNLVPSPPAAPAPAPPVPH